MTHRTRAAFAVVALFACLALAVVPDQSVVPLAHAASPVTTGTSLTSDAIISSIGHNVFFAAGLWWNVYVDGVDVVYRTSSTGATWSSSTIIRVVIGGGYGDYLAVESNPVTDGFCYVYAGDNVAGTNSYWRCGKLGTGGTITFYQTEHTLTKTDYANEGGGQNEAIQNDTKGDIWILANTGPSSGSYQEEFWEITGNGATATKVKNCAPSQCDLGTQGGGEPIALKLPGGEMAFAMESAAGVIQSLMLITWSGSAFNTPVLTANHYIGTENGITGTTIGSSVYLAGETSAANNPAYVESCAYPCASLATAVQIVATTGGGWVALSSDNSSDLDAVYLDHTAPTTTIDYSQSTNSGTTWGSSTALASGETAVSKLEGGDATFIQTGCLGVSWLAGSGSPYNVRFTILGTCVSTVTTTVTCTLSQWGTNPTVPVTVSAGSVSPTSFVCSHAGTATVLTTNPSVTITGTVPGISGGVGYWWSGGANTTTTAAPSSGSGTWSLTVWELVVGRATATSESGISGLFDTGLTWPQTCTQAGAPGSCSISSTSAASDSVFLHIDFKSVLTYPTLATGSASGIRWMSTGTLAFNETAGNWATNVNYWRQVDRSYEATPVTPNAWDASFNIPVTGTYLGSAGSLVGTITTLNGGGSQTAGPFWSDSGQNASLPYRFDSWQLHAEPHSFAATTGLGTDQVTYDRVMVTTTVTTTTTTTAGGGGGSLAIANQWMSETLMLGLGFGLLFGVFAVGRRRRRRGGGSEPVGSGVLPSG